MLISADTSKKNESLQDYIWFAEYEDKSVLREFNGIIENKFEKLNEHFDKIKIFGLLGKNDNEIFFCLSDGVFKIGDNKLELKLNNKKIKYVSDKSLISFKHAFTEYDFKKDKKIVKIDAFFVGFKSKIEIDGHTLDMKIIFKIMMDDGISCGIKLSGEEEVNNLKINLFMNNKKLKNNNEVSLNKNNNFSKILEIKF